MFYLMMIKYKLNSNDATKCKMQKLVNILISNEHDVSTINFKYI